MDKKLRAFEATMQLKDLKAGDTVTETHMAAINFFLGGMLDAARKIPIKEVVIEFPNGVPTVTKNELGVGINVAVIDDIDPDDGLVANLDKLTGAE